jgi:hypothetical protein
VLRRSGIDQKLFTSYIDNMVLWYGSHPIMSPSPIQQLCKSYMPMAMAL